MGLMYKSDKVVSPFSSLLEEEQVQVKGMCTCSICEKKFVVSISKELFEDFANNPSRYLLSHIFTHGEPRHGMGLSIDKRLSVRHSYPIQSFQFD